jgi:cytochrome c-type biogenesis protein CcmH
VEAGQATLQTAVTRLMDRLKAEPDNGQGWLLLARTVMMQGNWDQAVDAFRNAVQHGAGGSDTSAGLGEALVMQAKGIVTPPAHEAFAAALKEDPKNPSARFYEALAAEQGGDPKAAIAQWRGLLADIPSNAPERNEVIGRITLAAKAAGIPVPDLPPGAPPEAQAAPGQAPPGPDAATAAAAAAMPEAERKAMIEGMVTRLAERLAAQPDDADGWLRLGRAYRVMGDRAKAADAYVRAAALKPGDLAARTQGVEAMVNGLRPGDAIPAQAVTLLREAEAIAPDAPEVLWYLGVLAVHDGKPAAARESWQRLVTKLPAGSEEAKLVQGALDSLKGR